MKEYLPRLNSLLDVSVNLDLNTSNSFEGIRVLLEQVDEEMRVQKKENLHLKERMQELLS